MPSSGQATVTFSLCSRCLQSLAFNFSRKKTSTKGSSGTDAGVCQTWAVPGLFQKPPGK